LPEATTPNYAGFKIKNKNPDVKIRVLKFGGVIRRRKPRSSWRRTSRRSTQILNKVARGLATASGGVSPKAMIPRQLPVCHRLRFRRMAGRSEFAPGFVSFKLYQITSTWYGVGNNAD